MGVIISVGQGCLYEVFSVVRECKVILIIGLVVVVVMCLLLFLEYKGVFRKK